MKNVSAAGSCPVIGIITPVACASYPIIIGSGKKTGRYKKRKNQDNPAENKVERVMHFGVVC
jgi:hypothetical protein